MIGGRKYQTEGAMTAHISGRLLTEVTRPSMLFCLSCKMATPVAVDSMIDSNSPAASFRELLFVFITEYIYPHKLQYVQQNICVFYC